MDPFVASMLILVVFIVAFVPAAAWVLPKWTGRRTGLKPGSRPARPVDRSPRFAAIVMPFAAR